MKKTLSAVLSILMILSAFSFTALAAGSVQSISIAPSELKGTCSTNKHGGAKTTATVYEGAQVMLVEPSCDTEAPQYASECAIQLDNSYGSKNILTNVYKYARMNYHFDAVDGDANVSNYIPVMNFRTEGAGFKNVTGSGALDPSAGWHYIDFDMSGVVPADDKFTQVRPILFGNKYVGTTVGASAGTVQVPEGTKLYIASLVFYSEMPGVPQLTGITVEPKTTSAYKGYETAVISASTEGQWDPAVSLNTVLTGNTSAATKLTGEGRVYIAPDETASTLTVRISDANNPALYDECVITVKEPKAPSADDFDEDNIVMTFGVTSDTHVSGSWNQARSVGKLAHMFDAFKQAAADEGLPLTAVVVNGDLIDGVANGGSNVQATSSYGVKAAQNYREVSFIRSVLEGKDTNHASTSDKINSGAPTASISDFGTGILDTDTQFFYALGNHDEGGQGIGPFNKEMSKGVRGSTGYVNTVYSAEYYAAIFCGWEYNYQSATAQGNDDGYDDEYLDYISRVQGMFVETDAAKLAEMKSSFNAKYTYTTADDALYRFEKYYGRDTEYTDAEYGLFYGNRHMAIGDDPATRIHFVAIEVSQSANSQAFLDKWASVSVSENPNKPIFVFTHYKMANTIYDSFDGSKGLSPVLNKYPQIIIWGGHTHTPLSNENAIMQDTYTSIESSVLAYLSMGSLLRSDIGSFVKNNYPADNPNRVVPDNEFTHENHSQGQCCWVQVDKDGNVRIKRMDVYRSYASGTDLAGINFNNNDKAVFVKQPWYVCGIDAEGSHLLAYTSARGNDANNPAPYFEDDAKAFCTPVIGGVTKITFDAAKDDDMVKYYFAEVYDGTTLVDRKALTSFFNEVIDQEDMLKKFPTYKVQFTGLDDSKDYTIQIVAYDCWNRASEAKICEIDESAIMIYTIDGKLTAFVDTTGKTTKYTMGGKAYNVYDNIPDAITGGADVIYFIKGEHNLTDLVKTNMIKNLTIIGVDKANNVFTQADTTAELRYDLTLENVTVNRTGTNTDNAIRLNGHNLVFNDVDTTGNPLSLFTSTGYTTYAKAGSLTVNGGNPQFANAIFGTGFNSGENAIHVEGDVNFNLGAGTYATISNGKNSGTAATANRINGSVNINITGGTYTGKITSSTMQGSLASIRDNFIVNVTGGNFTSAASIVGGLNDEKKSIEKNSVIMLTGGTFEGTTVGAGATADTNVAGTDLYIISDSIFENINFKPSANTVLVTVPDDLDAIGDAAADGNGFITGFAIKQHENRESLVNGTPATSVTFEKGKTYAISYAAKNLVTFNANGGTGTLPTDITGAEGTTVSVPATAELTKEHYSFGGWALTADGTEAVTSVKIPATITVLYAIWVADPMYTATFDANGGIGTVPEAITDFAGVTIALPSSTLINKGYDFVGWSDKQDATEALYPFVMPEGGVTLYAVWTVHKEKAVYLNGASTSLTKDGSLENPYTTIIEAMNALGASGGYVVICGPTSLTPTSGAQSGGVAGASNVITTTDPNTGIDYAETAGAYAQMERGIVIKTHLELENLTLHYTGNKYAYFNANGNVFTVGKNVKFTEESNQKILFRGGGDGWSGPSTYTILKGENIYGQINAGSQGAGNVAGDVTLVFEGGSYTGDINLGSDGTPNADNYIGGNINCIVNDYGTGKTFKTKCNIPTVKGAVNFVFNNDTYSAIETKTLNLGSAAIGKGIYIVDSSAKGTVTPTATVGQFTIETEEAQVYVNGVLAAPTSGNVYTLSGADDNIYTITYKTPGKATVSFDLNGGEGTVPASVSGSEGDTVALPDGEFTKTGYTFIGWAETSDATEALESYTIPAEDVTLYAVYKADTHKVILDAGIGSVLEEMAEIEGAYGETVELPTDYTFYGTGLEYIGWSLTGKADELVTSVTIGDADVTVYAVYENIGTGIVTPGVTDAELPEGTYLVVSDSEETNAGAEDAKSELEDLGAVESVAKVDIKLISAANGAPVQPESAIPVTVECASDLTGKIVKVFHYNSDDTCTELPITGIDGKNASFSISEFSTFEIVALTAPATYITVGQFNAPASTYTVTLYFNGPKANAGTFGFAYDDSVYTFMGFEASENVIELEAEDSESIVSGTWAANVENGAFIGGEDENVEIGKFTFTCDAADYDMEKAAARFVNKAEPVYAPHDPTSLTVEYMPIVCADTYDEEPITVIYTVSGNIVTVRADGDTPCCFAKIKITKGDVSIATIDVENEETATGIVPFSFTLGEGTFTLTVVKNGYLEYSTEITVDDDLEIDDIELIAGDIRSNTADEQGDGIIDLADFIRVTRGFDTENASELVEHVDINEDGVITVADLAFVKSNYGLTK